MWCRYDAGDQMWPCDAELVAAVYARSAELRKEWLEAAKKQLVDWANDLLYFNLHGPNRPSERLNHFTYEHGGTPVTPVDGALDFVLKEVRALERKLGLVNGKARVPDFVSSQALDPGLLLVL